MVSSYPSSVVGTSIWATVLWGSSASMVTVGLRLHGRLPLLLLLPRTSSTSMRLASTRRAARTIVGTVSPSAA